MKRKLRTQNEACKFYRALICCKNRRRRKTRNKQLKIQSSVEIKITERKLTDSLADHLCLFLCACSSFSIAPSTKKSANSCISMVKKRCAFFSYSSPRLHELSLMYLAEKKKNEARIKPSIDLVCHIVIFVYQTLCKHTRDTNGKQEDARLAEKKLRLIRSVNELRIDGLV